MKTSGPTQRFLAFAATAALVLACGSDPKPEPVTAPPTAVTAPPDVPDAGAAPEEADAGPKEDPKVAECAKLQDDAQLAMDAERIAVDKECKKDADCVGVKGRACGFTCVTAAIPKSLEKDWNAVAKKTQDDQCKKYNDNDCAKLKPGPAPECKDRKVACENKHCVLKDK
ncbi:MAG: hypothetical protein KIT84_35765 [Labilithrix sp.]|nr:hypothetical protein [Labilithrix sp.]MCW5816411.1 hypothetical protein [Labilithrix sp.]